MSKIKLNETSIKIKELISNEVGMGTFGLVELELIEIQKNADRQAKLKAIHFGTWYSGMDRAKVERAYERYLNENF